MSTLEKAVEIAARAHAGQRDKAGAPYLLHPLRVMLSVHGEEAQMAAVLHDVVEDTEVTIEQLRAEGFAEAVLSAVAALTKLPGEARIAAAERAAANPIALQVKLADVSDNMDPSRISHPTERDLARLAEYTQVKALLQARQAQSTFVLWALDDNAANLEMIERSFEPAVRELLQLRSFLSAEAFLAAFTHELSAAAPRLPDFVLLDFFLGSTYGSEVLARLRTDCRNAGVQPGVLIAHSSMPEFSALMVEQGADFSLEKVKGQSHSAALAKLFASAEALVHVRSRRRPLDSAP